MEYLSRHARGDWGVVDREDWRANDRALVESTRLFSAYLLKGGTKIWIITEADRAATTVLLPEEYERTLVRLSCCGFPLSLLAGSDPYRLLILICDNYAASLGCIAEE